MASPRRSGRQRVPNKKYEEDAIQTLNEVLSSDSEEDGILQQMLADPVDDMEFSADVAAAVSSEADSISTIVSEGSGIVTPEEEYEDAHSYASSDGDDGPTLDASVYRRPRSKNQYKPQASNTRSRGVPDNDMYTHGRTNRAGELCGPAKEDLKSLARSLEQWEDELALPKRSNLRHQFSHTGRKRNLEVTTGWDWYRKHGGRQVFAQMQRSNRLGAEEGRFHTMNGSRPRQDVLLGPYGRQKVQSLHVLKPFDSNVAWSESTSHPHERDPKNSRRPSRHAWLLNIGNRVRSLDWATNYETGAQYLAVSIKSARVKIAAEKAPAFTPLGQTPSSIQLWSFPQSIDVNAESSMSYFEAPKLEQVLCVDWGDAKQLKWCHLPQDATRDDNIPQTPINLLASVWDDGFTRVLDIELGTETGSSTSYLKCESAACTIPPLANAICTTCCWLSPMDLAVGHSNGFLAIYSIVPDSLSSDSSADLADPNNDSSANAGSDATERTSFPRPRTILSIHQTYITSVISAYPSFPTLIMSASMDGYMRLTSLLSPTTSYVLSRRTHAVPHAMSYHSGLHGCVFPDEQKEMVCYTALRHWGYGLGFAEAHGLGGIRAMDAGKMHAAVAFGCSDGSVTVTNPMKRIIHPKENAWQQTVFRHEWARKQNQAAPDLHRGNNSTQDDEVNGVKSTEGTPLGICRITESYKPQMTTEDRPALRKIIKSTGNAGRGGGTTTIYEEDTGVTAICWNPSLNCGTWLAVGWGSGLIRVEDVGI